MYVWHNTRNNQLMFSIVDDLVLCTIQQTLIFRQQTPSNQSTTNHKRLQNAIHGWIRVCQFPLKSQD